ncbi:hypothetical protein DFH06DRAFT_1122385 [Mycena polygramma]|nr:hypothetical protein DFH06DRAFT_1122385 [Mycena polygramma]
MSPRTKRCLGCRELNREQERLFCNATPATLCNATSDLGAAILAETSIGPAPQSRTTRTALSNKQNWLRRLITYLWQQLSPVESCSSSVCILPRNGYNGTHATAVGTDVKNAAESCRGNIRCTPGAVKSPDIIGQVMFRSRQSSTSLNATLSQESTNRFVLLNPDACQLWTPSNALRRLHPVCLNPGNGRTPPRTSAIASTGVPMCSQELNAVLNYYGMTITVTPGPTPLQSMATAATGQHLPAQQQRGA